MTHVFVAGVATLLIISIGLLFVRTDRDWIGFYGVLAGALSGVIGIILELYFAVDDPSAVLTTAHYRLNLLGFLGVTGVSPWPVRWAVSDSCWQIPLKSG